MPQAVALGNHVFLLASFATYKVCVGERREAAETTDNLLR
jgi:hypothetical protein